MSRRRAVVVGWAMLVLAAEACGTVDWTFDTDRAIVDAGAIGFDAASVETGPTADSGSVPEADLAETAASEASSWRDWSADAQATCTSDSDCASAGLHCDTASGECVECVSSADCGQGLACESLQCVASCAGADSCPAATPICNDQMACVPCTTNAECANATAGTGRVCLTSTGQCVECLRNSDCAQGYCNQSTNACGR